MTTARTRTFSWEDPAVVPATMKTLSGLEVLRGVIEGTFPAPAMARLMDIRLIEVDLGRAVFESMPAEFHYNPLGTVHGGMAATLLDSAMGCAVHSTLAAGDRYTTLEIKVNYLRALTVDTGRVHAIGTLVHSGRTTALAEARVVDAGGTVYAHATSTCLIKRHDAARG